MPTTPRATPLTRREVLVAIGGFVIFVAVVLSKATAMLEPDDFAYRASIVALSHGHILLTNAQYISLQRQLSAGGGKGILQWHHLASGKWISEKNPGYPFFAVLFYMMGALRVSPLFYGALGCVGLFYGARAWLGKWAGTYAVWLYCSSGAALVFAWRATMPTFSDASLIAAGFGALLWVLCKVYAPPRRRFLVGLCALLALEGAVFIRYTDAVELAVAVGAVLLLRRSARLSWRTVMGWLASVLVFTGGLLAFNQWAYGGATSSGYSAGEISFSLSSFWPNLKGMPSHLTTSMPLWILAALAFAWILARWIRLRDSRGSAQGRLARRDVVIALFLGAGWLGLWALYLTYTWTVSQLSAPGGGTITVHVIRFYLPAVGPIALLVTWLMMRFPHRASASIVVALAVAGLLSFHALGVPNVAPGDPPGAGNPPLGIPPPGGPGPNGVAPSGSGP
jgi:hypothetical protein